MDINPYVAAALVVLFGTLVTAYITRRNKIADFRQAWIDALRGDIAAYVGAAERWMDKYIAVMRADFSPAGKKDVDKLIEESLELSNKASVLLARIQLRINPRDNKYKAEDDKFLSVLEQLIDQEKMKTESPEKDWRTLADEAVLLGRELLKREWEVTKGWWGF